MTVDVNKVVRIPVLVDSGAGGSFINAEPVNHYNLPTQDLRIPAMAYNVDGTQNKHGQMTKFMNANLNFGDHVEQVKLYVSDIGKQNIILGYPWLKESNPIIDLAAPSINWMNTSVSATTVEEERDLLNHFINKGEVVYVRNQIWRVWNRRLEVGGR